MPINGILSTRHRVQSNNLARVRLETMLEVINVSVSSEQSLETLGTKPKFWFKDDKLGQCLCKIVRPNTGEDWSEVLSAGIASAIALPHAEYHLANYDGKRAVVSPSVVQKNDALLLGNELLVRIAETYDVGAARFHQTAHTVNLVFTALESIALLKFPAGWLAPPIIKTPPELFVGYLALDALVGNTDRHHENWGIIATLERPSAVLRLAPTFDHASSLGCHELDARKAERLRSNDKNFSCEAYAARARSCFFRDPADNRPMGPVEAFVEASNRHRTAARHWIERVAAVTDEHIAILLNEVPEDRLSTISREFATRLLQENRRRILGVGQSL